MRWFDYHSATSVGEAVGLLSGNPRARIVAGGTDLLVQMRTGSVESDLLIDVKRIPELNELSHAPRRGLTLGAAVPCCRIYEDAAVRAAYPALAEVAALIGGVQIQNRASLGGNLCNAAPSADSVPVFIAYGATCRIAGPSGMRHVPVEEFCTGPGLTILRPGEILVSFDLPSPPPHSGGRYLRFIPRNEMDIAVAGAGAQVVLENGHFRSARIALASVAPTPLFVPEAGNWLAGKAVTSESIREAAEIARGAARPITDMRGTADYRRHLCAVLTRGALEAAVERAQGGRE